MIPATFKPKKCKACGDEYLPRRPLQQTCFKVECCLSYGKRTLARSKRLEAKQERREHKAKLRALMTRRDWAKKAQKAVNAWVRLRDRHLPCISCPATDAKWDAGHYRSVGAQPSLRFEPLNMAKQCAQCNQKKAGNAVEFRIGLVQRIGADRVAWLEQEHPPKKYTIPELQAIEAKYKALCKGFSQP